MPPARILFPIFSIFSTPRLYFLFIPALDESFFKETSRLGLKSLSITNQLETRIQNSAQPPIRVSGYD
jgi:hypothetical protein